MRICVANSRKRGSSAGAVAVVSASKAHCREALERDRHVRWIDLDAAPDAPGAFGGDERGAQAAEWLVDDPARRDAVPKHRRHELDRLHRRVLLVRPWLRHIEHAGLSVVAISTVAFATTATIPGERERSDKKLETQSEPKGGRETGKARSCSCSCSCSCSRSQTRTPYPTSQIARSASTIAGVSVRWGDAQPTASRDLRTGVDDGDLEREGRQATTRYRFRGSRRYRPRHLRNCPRRHEHGRRRSCASSRRCRSPFQSHDGELVALTKRLRDAPKSAGPARVGPSWPELACVSGCQVRPGVGPCVPSQNQRIYPYPALA
jgi:hypothetical protein